MKYHVSLYDKYTDEFHRLTVEAKSAEEAEDVAWDQAEKCQWPRSLKVTDVEEA